MIFHSAYRRMEEVTDHATKKCVNRQLLGHCRWYARYPPLFFTLVGNIAKSSLHVKVKGAKSEAPRKSGGLCFSLFVGDWPTEPDLYPNV